MPSAGKRTKTGLKSTKRTQGRSAIPVYGNGETALMKRADPKAGPIDCGRNLERQPQSDLQAPRLRAVREPAIALSDSERRGR